MDNIVRVVKPRLRRGPITLAARDHYLQVFAAWERLTACPRRKRLEIAQELKLVDPKALDPNALEAVDEEERGLHRLRSLERTYRHLVRAFGLPAIPPRATAPQR